jgi:flagellar hook-length control protein FliK
VKSSETHRFDSADKLDATARPADALETGVSETTTQSVNDLDNAEVQKPHALNFLEIINALEELGILDSAGGSSLPNKADEILSHKEGMVALKMLIARLEQNDFVPSAEIKAELDRIQQFLADTQPGNVSSHNDEDPLGELADSRSTEPPDLNQFIKRIVSGQEDQRSSSGVHMGESDSGQKPSDPFVKMNRVATKLPNDIRQTGSLQPAENSQAALPSENREKTDSLKLAVEARTVGVEANENVKEPRSLETLRTDASGLKDGSVNPDKTGSPNQAGLLNRISSPIDSGSQLSGESAQQNLPNNESSSVIKMTNDVQVAKALSQGQRYALDSVQDNTVNNESSPVSKTMHDAQAAKTSDHEQRYGGEPVQNNTVNNESSPVSKMIHDAQLVKDNHTRMDAAMNDEPGGKVTKVDAGNNDNGLLSSQNQTADKAFEATSPSRQTDAGQDSLRTQTLDQIVRKAVIYMRNGQHEAKIDLKPEFLGHVRLQVTTENHQVTVRVLTEFGFVKDMVENNIHQLKADLQQQGLNVDKLEVAVSNDSDENKHPQEKTGLAKDRQRSVARTNPENREEETREQAGNSGLKKAGTTTVDYFA